MRDYKYLAYSLIMELVCSGIYFVEDALTIYDFDEQEQEEFYEWYNEIYKED